MQGRVTPTSGPVVDLRDERGFTLIELAIVLVIIGLIIGGILGGQQLLTNARINNAVQALQSYKAAVASYRGNYNALPGDDRGAQARWGAAEPQATGAADGALQGTYNSAQATNETRIFWAHLRAAKLIQGDATDTTLPTNPFNGVYGVQDSVMGLPGPSVCISNVDGSVARIILTRLGTGNRDTGDTRAIQLNGVSPNITGAPAAGAVPAADNDLPYVICTRL